MKTRRSTPSGSHWRGRSSSLTTENLATSPPNGARSVLSESSDPQDEATRTRVDYPGYRVEPGERVSLATVDPGETEHYEKKKDVARELEKQRRRIQDLQERLYAENQQGLLIVLQALDTGGKDGTIKHVFSGVNPQGCRVSSFKLPSAEEAHHDFLWRITRVFPPGVESVSSTAPTTRTCSSSASRTWSLRRSGEGATSRSMPSSVISRSKA